MFGKSSRTVKSWCNFKTLFFTVVAKFLHLSTYFNHTTIDPKIYKLQVNQYCTVNDELISLCSSVTGVE